MKRLEFVPEAESIRPQLGAFRDELGVEVSNDPDELEVLAA